MDLAIIDAKIVAYLSNILKTQNIYFNVNGKYLQALQSHTNIPDGSIIQISRNNVRPSDVDKNWPDLCAYPVGMDYAIRIDVYETENDKGCRLIIHTKQGDIIWQKSIPIIGPDLFVQDWHPIEKSIIDE